MARARRFRSRCDLCHELVVWDDTITGLDAFLEHDAIHHPGLLELNEGNVGPMKPRFEDVPIGDHPTLGPYL